MSFKGAFKWSGEKDIKEFVIPYGFTSIGKYAFNECTSLTDVVIPNSVAKIGKSAFFGCSSLTNIEIPNCVTKIGKDAFEGCSSLTKIFVPSIFINIKNVFPKNCKLEEEKMFNNQNMVDNFL